MSFKNDRGSMSVYVSIVLFTMLFILLAIFFTSSAIRKNQLSTVIGVKESYEKDNSKADEIYSNLEDKLYITDGLILQYDAINNTGNGHSSS